MNREIKFRCWDKKQKVMSIGLPFQWFVNGYDIDMEFPKTDESLPLTDFCQFFDDFKIMQFTGLKDKHSKEIYEGDIVKNVDGDLRKVVYWNAGFEMRLMDGKLDSYNTIWYFDVEIVGNIYENPELIK